MVKLSTSICCLAFASAFGRELSGVVSADGDIESMQAMMRLPGQYQSQYRDRSVGIVALAVRCKAKDYRKNFYLAFKQMTIGEQRELKSETNDAVKIEKLISKLEHNQHSSVTIEGTDRVLLKREEQPILMVPGRMPLKRGDGTNITFPDTENSTSKVNFEEYAEINGANTRLTFTAYAISIEREKCPNVKEEKDLIPVNVKIAPIDGDAFGKAVTTTAESALFGGDEPWSAVEYVLIAAFAGVPLCCCLLFLVCKAISKKKDQDRSRKEQQEAEQNSSPRLQRPRVNRPHAGNRQ